MGSDEEFNLKDTKLVKQSINYLINKEIDLRLKGSIIK